MIQAVGNNVVLVKKTSNMSNGIYMPTNNGESYYVLNVGNTVQDIKAGDVVVLLKTPFKYLDGQTEYYIIDAKDIVAIVEEKNE